MTYVVTVEKKDGRHYVLVGGETVSIGYKKETEAVSYIETMFGEKRNKLEKKGENSWLVFI